MRGLIFGQRSRISIALILGFVGYKHEVFLQNVSNRVRLQSEAKAPLRSQTLQQVVDNRGHQVRCWQQNLQAVQQIFQNWPTVQSSHWSQTQDHG